MNLALRLALVLPALLIGITVHEFSHALVADAQGDDTARRLGRVSLNPIRHLDPLGTFMILMTVIGGIGIGWGKPVPVNPSNLRMGRTGMALVSVAGVVANLITAFVCGQVLRSGLLDRASALAEDFLVMVILINVSLAVFNLLPISPLDGFNLLASVSPPSWARLLRWLRNYGPMILLLVIIAGQVPPHVNILGRVMTPIIRALIQLFTGEALL